MSSNHYKSPIHIINTDNKNDSKYKRNKSYNEKTVHKRNNTIMSVINNNISNNKLIFKTNYFPSLTSIMTAYQSSATNTNTNNSSYTDKKIKIKKISNPIILFDSKQNLYTSLDEEIKNNIYNYKENKKLYKKIILSENKKENNLNKLLMKLSLVKQKLKSLNKKNGKIKLNGIKLKTHKTNNNINETSLIPKLNDKKKNFSFNKNIINNNSNSNINTTEDKDRLFKDKKIFSYNKTKYILPNLSIDDENIIVDNNKKIHNIKNIKLKNIKKSSFNNNIENINKTLITFNKNKEEIENNKNRDFIKRIKNRQFRNLIRRFKLLEKKNEDEEYISYKNNIFPIDTIKMLTLKRKELALDKFRNEYLMKLDNYSINNMFLNYSKDYHNKSK
jgi:hypothetical protein